MHARRPRALVVVCLLVLVEAAALAGLAAAFVVDLARGAELPGPTAFLAVFLLTVAAVLVLAARALAHGRRWARSPVLTWQLLLLVMAVGWFSAEPSPWAAGVVVVALMVGVGLLLPTVVAATTAPRTPPPGA